MARDEEVVARRSPAVESLVDLLVRAVDSDAEHLDEHPSAVGHVPDRGFRNLGQMGRARLPRMHRDRLHVRVSLSQEGTRYSRGVEQAVQLEEMRLVEALRAGDERVFEQLVRMYQGTLLRVAQMYVSSRAVAEEVVQETWLAVLNGIDRFEGRSSLKTWIFRILANRAKTRAQRDSRTIPFSALRRPDTVPEPAVDAARFN